MSAYLNLTRTRKVVDFARQSEANIKRQTGLEEAKVEAGRGFSTDVLQSKERLAGARARRVAAEGALRNALNRFRNVFGSEPVALDKLSETRLPTDLIPQTLGDAVAAALEKNPAIRIAHIATLTAADDAAETFADEFFPTLEASASATWKEDVNGTIGPKQEQLIKVELNYPFNLGLTGRNAYLAKQSSQSAAIARYKDARDRIEERLRNAWQQLETATEAHEYRRNQANLAEAFLENARKEQQLGRRSLLDVLDGETRWINARSDAASAETDIAIATFTLLREMGRLKLDAVR